MHKNLLSLLLTSAVSLTFFACSGSNQSQDGEASNYIKVGSYAAHYDAITGEVTYELTSAPGEDSSALSPLFALSPNDSAGVNDCAIDDTSKSTGEINKCMGLIDPDSCSTDYNDTTHVLSFYAKIVNKSNLADDGSPYTYTDPATYPTNTTFYSPFSYVITGLQATSGSPGIITAVNTNLSTADCGTDGLNLADINDDADSNGLFDCVWPDKAYDSAFEGYPGFDFSPHVTGGKMDPGDDTGCVLFMQYTLSTNESFTLYFDMLAVMDDGSLPPTPNVTSHSDGDYVNTGSITLSGDNCTPTTGTVYVEGGSSTVNTTCGGGGTFSLSVPLNANTANNLTVYQIVGPKQSGADTLTINHDNIAPSVLGSNPADGATSVDRNTNCVVTFSEPMDASTITSANLQIVRVSTGSPIGITATPATGNTQAVLTPNSKPLAASADYDCKALVGLTDRAGNALSSSYSAVFTTAGGGGFFQDKTPPKVSAMTPADNTPDASPSTIFTIYFDEPIDPDTIVGSVVDPVCNLSGGNIPNVFVFELNSCNPGTSVPIDGTTALNAEGTIATFTPDNPSDMETNNCYGFVVTSCVADLSGNTLPNRGTRNIGAYGGNSITYNSYNVFFTGGADVTNPELVHVGPMLNVNSVHERVFPHMVFNEPLDPATITLDNFYMTEFGNPAHITLTLEADPTLQKVMFKPISAIDLSTNHVLTATGAVADFSGNLMDAPQTSNFTSQAVADTTAPTVVSVSPDDGESIQDKCPYIDINFSEPMNELTLNSSNIKLIRVRNGNVKPTSMDIADNGMHVRLIAESSLNHGSGDRNDWEIFISGNVEDRAGNKLGADDSRIFEANRETIPPAVTAVVPPAGGTTNQNGSVLVFFSEVMDKSTLIASYFPITGCNPIVFAGPEGNWAVANCINQMSAGGKTIVINRNVRDYYHRNNNQSCEIAAGNRMVANILSNFTVLAGDDTTPPTVSNLSDVNPQDGSTNVPNAVTPSVTFSEAMDPRTIMPSTVFLMDQQGNPIDTTTAISTDAKTVTLTPLSPLPSPGIYYIVVSTAVRDLSGGNAYDGLGGENTEVQGILRSCFSTDATSCP